MILMNNDMVPDDQCSDQDNGQGAVTSHYRTTPNELDASQSMWNREADEIHRYVESLTNFDPHAGIQPPPKLTPAGELELQRILREPFRSNTSRQNVANARTYSTEPFSPSSIRCEDTSVRDKWIKLRAERRCEDWRGIHWRNGNTDSFKVAPCRTCEACRMWRVDVATERAVETLGDKSYQHAPMDKRQWDSVRTRIRRSENRIEFVTVPISATRRIAWLSEPMGPCEEADTAETVENRVTEYQHFGTGKWGQQSSSGPSLSAIEAEIMGEEKPDTETEKKKKKKKKKKAEIVGFFDPRRLDGDTAKAKTDALAAYAVEAGVSVARVDPSTLQILTGTEDARAWLNTLIGYRFLERPEEPPMDSYMEAVG